MAMTADDRRALLQKYGYIAPDNDGFFGELADSAAQSFVSGARGVGATINELTGNSSMRDYFQGVLDRNQQWNAPDNLGVGGYLGRAVGSAAGSTAAALTAATAGTLLGGPGVGVAAGVTTVFAQTFGDNVQRNREAGYSDDKAYGMAFLESGIDAAIENLPFGIVGKSGKIIAQAGRLRNISAAGKRALLNKIGQKLSAEVGQKQAQNLLVQWGKQAALSGLGEGGEEGLQYLNSYINQTLGGTPNAEFSVDEFADAVTQGIIGGFALGGAMNVVTGNGIRRNPDLNRLDQTGEQVAPAVGDMQNNEAVTADTIAVNSLLDELVAGVGEDFGVKVDYTDNYQGEAEISDGFYEPKTDTIYLDRQDAGAELGITLGHELKHYLDRNHPELVTAFDKLWQSGQTEEGKAFFADMKKKLDLSDDISQKEFGAEVFGRILERPDTMKYYAEALEKQSPGMGEKFIRIFRDFVAAIKKRLAGMYAGSPDMEQLFNNVTAMEQEAGNVLAELRRRNGNSSQVENVVGAKGNSNVETVPTAQINVDAQRFQFKSNTSKSSGVNESNKLGGDWDPRTAGNLYLWQDKSGKMYVVNGHHRLELARRNNVENLNAIIDRETDGVTAAQARRNGVLINIRDGQGDVRDYAAFVRSEKLSEDEAKSQGVTARQKGRSGFALGKSGDTLYEAYRNEEIPESKAVIIAEVAQGNEAIEYAGIRLAVDRKLAGEILRQTLKLAAQNSSGGKSTAAQGSLFDMVDDTVLREWELIGKAAATHIKEIRTRIEAAKDAIKNPEAAKSLGVKTTKGAEKLLAQAQEELARWENYATNPELMAQLRNEAGIAPQEDVSKTENTTIPEVQEEVVSAENAQTIAPEDNADGLFDTQEETVSKKESVEPVVKENLTTETTATPKENLAVAVTKIKNTTDRYRTKGKNPTYYKSLIEVEQAEKTAKSKGQKFEYEKNPDYVPTQKKQAEQAAQEVSGVPDNPAVGESFNEFYKRFTPQLESILAKNKQMFSSTIGNKLEDEWSSATSKAIVKAYGYFNSKSGASVDTYVSRAIENAIKSVNRKHNAEFVKTGGGASLNQTNEKGEELQEAVAAENAEFSSNKTPQEKLNDYTKWKATLKPRDQRILDLSESGLPPSLIARSAGVGMTKAEVEKRLKALAVAARTDGELQFRRKPRPSIQKRDATLAEVAKLNMQDEVSRVIESGMPVGKYVFKNFDDKQKTIDGAIRFLKEFSRKIVPLSDGRIVYFMPDARAFERGFATAWAEYGIHAVTSSGKQIPGKEYNERLFNQNKLDNLDRIIPIIQQENVFGKFDNKNPAKDGVIFVGTSHEGKRIEIITRLDEYGNPQADLTEVTVLATNKESNIPPHKPLSEVVEAVAQHQAAGFSPSTSDNIPQSGEKSNKNLEYRKKILHHQINPVVRDGKVRDEYADLLENKEYTPEKIAEWQDKAFEWILRHGGIVQAAKDILSNKAPADGHIAEIARRYILESDVFRNDISRTDRTKLYELEIDARSEWGRTGRVMQLAAMQIKDIASVQAILNKLHKNMPPEDAQKLRNQIKDEMGIDIFELPENIVNDKSKLDKILRAELAHKASWRDKFYEYWVNGLLSGPGTHVSNFLGNTANAVYELGLKRFTEALVNVAAGRKDGATFGEFKEMIRAFNWDNAKKAFARAWDVELIDPNGKFLEHNQTAIGGKTGRVIRTPGRLLKAADAMARAIIEPMETAAYAYRMGVQEGLSGKGLAGYIAKQLSDPESVAYAWANQRAKEITFQEDSSKSIRALMALKESDGAVGFALRVFLPFLKTPANILKQGVRKSVLGSSSLLLETGKLAMGKRTFDSEYISRVAEQIIAWSVAMTLYGLSDDEELPFITGSSAAYGSAEYGFKASKMPPYSIRFGNTYLSYQRIEPFATGLAAVADALQAFRNARNGKDGTAVMKDLMNSVQQIILEKSYIDGISEAINFAKDPQRYGSRAATNLLASALPNIYRQTVHALSEDVGESKSRNVGRDWWIDQFFIVTNRAGVTAAVPKIDYFGRMAKKDDWGDTVLSPLWRLLPVKKVNSNMDSAERLIWNYNQRNPNEEYYPGIPRNTFTHNGVKMYFAGDDYRDFAVQSGQLAHKQINNAIRAGRLNVENPTEKDIKLIRKIFTRARKETQDKLLQQKRGNQL